MLCIFTYLIYSESDESLNVYVLICYLLLVGILIKYTYNDMHIMGITYIDFSTPINKVYNNRVLEVITIFNEFCYYFYTI